MKFSKLLLSLVLAATAVLGQAKFDVVCYTPYRDGQTPDGPFPTTEQLREDIRILKQVTPAIKISALGELGKTIVEICHQEGLGIHVGAWLGNVNDPVYAAVNRQEIEDLVYVAGKGYPEVKSLIVGSECLLRNEMTPAQLIGFINEVKDRTDGYPVTTAEIYANYIQYKGTATDIAAAVDYILYNGHPYWEQKDAVSAAATVIERWKILRATFPGKDLFLGEEGWPTAGEIYGNAFPSEYNQTVYFQNLQQQIAAYEASSGGVKLRHMTFEAFDQSWNRNEGRVGGYWGLFYADRTAKPAVKAVYGLPLALDWVASYGDQTVEIEFSEPVVSGAVSDGAENVNNYAISNDAVIYKATLKPDRRTVQLVTSMMYYNTPYTLSVSNIRKASGGSPIAAGTSKGFTIENPSESYALSNLVMNPDFSQGLKHWVNGFYSGGAGVMEVIDGELVVKITSAGTSGWCVQPQQTDLKLINGKTYRLAFDMRSDGTRKVNVNCVKDASPYTFYSNNPAVEIGASWRHFCFSFTMTQPTDAKCKIEFDLGNAGTGNIYIDNVVLQETAETCPTVTASACENGLNLVENCGFDVGMRNWVAGWYEGSGGEMIVQNGELVAHIADGGPNSWSAQAFQRAVLLEQGKSYRLSFEARADWERPIVVSLREDGGAYASYSGDNDITLSTTKTRYCFTFTMTYPTNGSKLEFDLGGQGNGMVAIDNVYLEQITDDCSFKPKTVVWAVNAAGPAFTANDGISYAADQSFSGGSTSEQSDGVFGTSFPVVYKTHRWGAWSYNRAMANGTYDVLFKFVEDWFNAPNKRVFSVSIEGQQVITDLDIYDRVGHDKAYDVMIPNVRVTDGSLTITTSSKVDWAIVAGIVVYGASSTNLPPVANAGSDRSGTVNAAVTLDGRGSSDPDNGPAALSYSWSQLNGPVVTLSGAATAQPAFTPAAAGTYTFRLTVSDGAASSSDDVVVTVISGPTENDLTDAVAGTITARGQNGTNEAAAKAFDNSSSTKWLDFSPTGSWIQYAFNDGSRYAVSKYTITSANDVPARDPASWQLLGSNDNGATWVTLDSRAGQVFAARFQKNTYTFTAPSTGFKVYRLNITSVYNLAGANCVQLSEIELFGQKVDGGTGDVLLSQGKATSQSSTYGGCVASRAVDGNTSGNWGANSLTHTNYDANAWWQVDLGTACQISEVRLWNRTDCCSDRLSNFKVMVSADGVNWTTQISYPGQAPTTTVISLGGVVGRYVRVQLNGTNHLSLAEAQVYGVSGAITSGTYKLINKKSGKSLDTPGGCAGATNATQLIQWDWNGNAGQQWVISDLGSGQYSIKSACNTAKSLDVDGWSTGDNGKIIFWDYAGGNNQRWYLDFVGNGTYRIRSVHSGKSVRVEGASTANGAKIIQYSDGTTESDRWILTRLP